MVKYYESVLAAKDVHIDAIPLPNMSMSGEKIRRRPLPSEIFPNLCQIHKASGPFSKSKKIVSFGIRGILLKDVNIYLDLIPAYES